MESDLIFVGDKLEKLRKNPAQVGSNSRRRITNHGREENTRQREVLAFRCKEAADYFSIGTKKMRNEIYQEQLSNIIPHVCWHTYCSNQAKAGMNPKTLQYFMGHTDIGITMNVYTHLGWRTRLPRCPGCEEVESARREQEKLNGVKEMKEKQSRKMFRVV